MDPIKVWITCSQMEKSMRQHASLNNRSTKLCYEVNFFLFMVGLTPNLVCNPIGIP